MVITLLDWRQRAGAKVVAGFDGALDCVGVLWGGLCHVFEWRAGGEAASYRGFCFLHLGLASENLGCELARFDSDSLDDDIGVCLNIYLLLWICFLFKNKIIHDNFKLKDDTSISREIHESQ